MARLQEHNDLLLDRLQAVFRPGTLEESRVHDLHAEISKHRVGAMGKLFDGSERR